MEIKLSNGMNVLKSNYIKLKTKDLIEFGYTSLTENEVEGQLEKILAKNNNLSIIGMFLKDDLCSEWISNAQTKDVMSALIDQVNYEKQ